VRVISEFACDSMAFVVEYVSDDDLGAFANQKAGVFGAHTAGAASDKRDFAVDSSHRSRSNRRRSGPARR
jgi:hypothetical protein